VSTSEHWTVRFDDEADEVILLDQTRLPAEVVYLRLSRPEEVREAILTLTVRGAPAIGIAAAYGAYLAVSHSAAEDHLALRRDFETARQLLVSARPTAVNLAWALDRMGRRLAAATDRSVSALRAALKDEADLIRAEDEDVCRRIGENGLALLDRGWGLLTHCNAGALATARYGTALSPIFRGTEQGYAFRVFADETRPLLQGARLTAWELSQAGIDVTLICDNMAASVMKRGWINAVLVGCDRVAANGDTANKIGTSAVAILANHYGIPFYVCAPLSTIDMACATGDSIPIEERQPSEVTEKWYTRRMAPEGVKVFNPAFDVTSADLVTAIVTERGVVRPPFSDGLRRITG